MNYNEAAGMLAEYRNQIAGIREKMRNAQASIEPEEVKDYEFVTPQDKARLSTLFGDKDTLFIIHNMGTSCVNCTMWADGFNGRSSICAIVRPSWCRLRTRPSDRSISRPV